MTIVEQQTINLLTRIAVALEAQAGDETAKATFKATNEARAKALQDSAKAAAAQQADEIAAKKAAAQRAVEDAQAAHQEAQDKLAAVQKPAGATA